MLDWLTTFIKFIGATVYEALPQSPFQQFIADISLSMYAGLGWLNWFIPVGSILAVMSVWLLAIGFFYLFKAILHWIGYSD